MPQGRKKTPFSGKAKREQLKSKKQNKGERAEGSKNVMLKSQNEEGDGLCTTRKLNYQPSKSLRDTNRYALQFHKETKEEIARRKELARHGLEPASEKEMEIELDRYFPEEMDFPKRPQWNYDMPKENLEMNENKYFTQYVQNLEEKFGDEDISFFELNLETWRQLWRVLEMSDIVLIIVDIRFPALMFPPSLYDYVTKTLNKQMILVLNKIDLAPSPLVAAWRDYFIKKYPNINVVLFTTIPAYNVVGKQQDKAGLQIRKRKGRPRMAAEGTKLLLDVCKTIVKNDVDLTSWENKITEESTVDVTENDSVQIGELVEIKANDTSYFNHEKFKDGVLTIGCLGQPNVGKSSLMNAIMGKKVVSVSRTPGHTKHFQTIFLTPTVRLCDCPGLVFPSKVPKTLQVLMGSFPIAQLREPFTSIKYLGERLDLPKLLRIDHPEGDDEWSAMDICDGWAKKRGYITAKAARLDSYRAANSLLRMALDGKISLCLAPPNYYKQKDFWKNHQDIEIVKWIKAISNEEPPPYVKQSDFTDDEEDVSREDSREGSNEAPENSGEDSSEAEEDAFCSSNKFSALQEG